VLRSFGTDGGNNALDGVGVGVLDRRKETRGEGTSEVACTISSAGCTQAVIWGDLPQPSRATVREFELVMVLMWSGVCS
jgi:hypothetical protein